MKIAFFIPDFAGGGAQHMIVNMANEFSRRGHQVDLVAVHASGPFKALIAPEVNIFDLKKDRAVKAVRPLADYLKNNAPDILLSALYHTNLVAVMARFLSQARKTKLILTERNLFSIRARHSKKWGDFLSTGLVKLLYPLTDHIVGISEGVAADIQQAAGLSANKVSYIHNPVITSETLGLLNAAQTDANPGKDQELIVTSGRLVEQKDHLTMLKAFSILQKKRPNVRLLILGEGPLRPSLERKIAELGLKDKVELAGFVGNPFLYFTKADLFVISSRWEGFCNVIVEALLCGLPVISTDCPAGPAEILENGKYGTLVPTEDARALAHAMAETLDHESQPERQIERAMDFTVEKICNQYEDLFQNIITGS